jgi:hypothetical protein
VEEVGGFQFAAAVCDAVSAATTATEHASPEAFRYRGVSLRPAVERGLYITLANHSELAEVYIARTAGKRAHLPHFEAELEQLAAGILLEGSTARRPSRWEPRRVAERWQWRWRAAADRRVASSFKRRSEREPLVLFVLDHPKYGRLIDPIVKRLQRVSAVVAAPPGADADVTLELPDSSAPLLVRAAGRGLWQRQHLAAQVDLVSRLIDRLQPRCLVVIEGGGPLDATAAAAARVAGIASVCVQHGWSPLVHSGFRAMPYDSMAVWGEGFREILEPWNVGVKFVVTGSPVLDAVAAQDADPALRDRVGGRPAVGVFLQPTSTWIEPHHLQALYELTERIAAADGDIAVLVREHPGHPLGARARDRLAGCPNVILAPAATHSLRGVLEVSDVAVSIYSTTLLEAAALGVPVVVFNPTSMPRMSPDLEVVGAGIEVHETDAAEAGVARLLSDTEYRGAHRRGLKLVRDRFFAGVDGQASRRVATLIDRST